MTKRGDQRRSERIARQAEEQKQLAEQRAAAIAAREEAIQARIERCESVVMSAAIAHFESGLARLPPRQHPDFLPSVWLLHFASLTEPFTRLVDSDLRLMPMATYEEAGDGPVKMFAAYWWMTVVEVHAALVGLTLDDFGRLMSEGFEQSYRAAVRSVPHDPSAGISNFHQFSQVHIRMQQSGLVDAIAKANLRVEIAKHFATTYTNAWNSSSRT